MNKILITLILFWSVATPAAAGPFDPRTNLALFARCYAHLTQLRLPLNHDLRAQVIAGTLSPVDACMQVFDRATLQASGANEGLLASDTPEARAVLRNFNRLHQLWFQMDKKINIVEASETYRSMPEIHDLSEPALHVTRTLFTPGVPYSDVVTLSSGLEGLRSNGPRNMDAGRLSYNPTACANSACNLKGYSSSGAIVDLNAGWVQSGELMGMRRLSLNPTKMAASSYLNPNFSAFVDYSLNPKSPSPIYAYKNDTANGKVMNVPVPIHVSKGGGVLGTSSYLLLNFGRPENLPMNGGIRVPRRWGQSLLRDLMCRNLPALRFSDASALVQTAPTTLTPPFRKSATCMQCHGAMDNIAGVARNMNYMAFANPPGEYYAWIEGLATWQETRPAETGPQEYDEYFMARPLNGKLFYRSYNGNLIDQAVVGIPGLGQAIAATPDLYVCAASRYFQYFTGVEVNLQDSGDPQNNPLNTDETNYRNLVVNMGVALQNDSTHSLRNVIKAIISSSVYKAASMRIPAQ